MYTARQKHKSSLYKRLSGGFLLLLVSPFSPTSLSRGYAIVSLFAPFPSPFIYLDFRLNKQTRRVPVHPDLLPGQHTNQRVPGPQVLLHPISFPGRFNAPTKTILPHGRARLKRYFYKGLLEKNRRITRKSKSRIYRTNYSSRCLKSSKDNVLKTAGTFRLNPVVETRTAFKTERV